MASGSFSPDFLQPVVERQTAPDRRPQLHFSGHHLLSLLQVLSNRQLVQGGRIQGGRKRKRGLFAEENRGDGNFAKKEPALRFLHTGFGIISRERFELWAGNEILTNNFQIC